MRLFWKIYVPVLISFVLVAFAISYIISGKQIADAEEHIVQANAMMSGHLVEEIESGLLEGRLPFEGLKKLSDRKDFLFWWVIQDDGKIYLADKVEFAGSNVADYFPRIADGNMTKRVFLNRDQEHGIFVQPFQVGKKRWAFWLGFSLRDISRMRKSIILVNAAIFVTALVLLGGTLYFIITHFTKPIKNLALAAGAIGSGDLSHRAQAKTGDELGDLALSFNTMADNLQKTTVSKAYMDNIIRTMKDPLIVIEPDRTISTVNEATCELLEFKEDELVRKPIDVIFATDQHGSNNGSTLEKLLRSGEFANHETLWKTRSGKEISVLVSGSNMGDGEGKRIRFVVTGKDITKLRQREDALRASEARNRLLIEESPVGIGIVQDGKITYVNPALIGILGCERADELLGESPLEFVASEDRDSVRAREKEQVAGSGAGSYYEIKGLKRNREPVDLSVWPRAIEYLGKSAILNFVVDTSEARILRSQLIQAQKMEALGTLAGGVAHDFNNILTIILGYSEMILLDTNEDDTCYGDLQKIIQTGHKGADLIQRLLTFTRQTEINCRPLNLNHEIKQVQTILSRTIPKMIETDLALSEDLATINADPVQIDQVLMNLAINAMDAMPEGGKLTVETKNVSLNGEHCRKHFGKKPGDHVLLTISDTGHGMSSEVLAHIFDPFFTTKGRDSRKGTGLGLAVVKGIVEQHEGHITCYSEPDLGTSFEIFFPAMATEMKSKEPGEGMELTDCAETILLVDDEELVRDLGKRILQKAGYRVLTASNGAKALACYIEEQQSVALVILDLIMPEMGGKQCLVELLRVNPQVRAIIASGYTEADTRNEAIAKGARGFVGKPYEIKEMLQTVRAVLDQR